MPIGATTKTAGIPISFPNNIEETARAMMVFLNAGGLQGGGVNFDAKIRRNSTDLEDLFHAHIGGADTFARGIMVADKVLNDPAFSSIVNGRYSSFDSANGFAFEQGKLSLCDLFDVATRQYGCHQTEKRQARVFREYFKQSLYKQTIMGNKSYLLRLTLVATLGGLLFGYDTGVIAGTVGSLDAFFIEPKGLDELAASSLKGWLVSIALIGCIVGGALAGLVGKKFGRKKGLLIAGVLFFISALGSALPELFFQPLGQGDHTLSTIFMIYRFIGGIGVGIASMLSPVYIAEIAPAKDRGKLVSYNQLAIVGGFMIVYFVNYFIALSGDDLWLNEIGWRYMFASELVPVSIFLGTLIFCARIRRDLWCLTTKKLRH
jgi:hypothetical protein